MDKSCHFCMQLNPTLLKISNTDVNDVINVIFPTKDINSFENSLACTGCLNSLRSIYAFIKTSNENNLQMPAATTPQDKTLCQTCLNPVKTAGIYLFDHFENAIPYYEIKEMLDYSALDLDIEYQKCPVICSVCWEELKKCYNFVKRYVKNETGITEYERESERITMIENFLKPIKSYESEDIGVTIVKEEPVEEENYHNFVDEVAIRNECNDADLMENVIYFKKESRNEPVQKKLYIKLKRLNLTKVIEKVKKGRKKKRALHKCQLCSYASGHLYNYRAHLLTHMTLKQCAENNVTLYECYTCTYRTKRKDCLIRHMKEVHRLDYVCEKCNYETNDVDLFAQHVKKEHANKVPSYRCHLCPFLTCTKIKLQQHAKKNHGDLKNITLKCGLCDFKTTKMSDMDSHKLQHTNMVMRKMYKCDLCSYEAKRKSSMDRHLVTHFSRKQLSDKLYPCQLCSYKSKRKDSLPNHIRRMHNVQKVENK